MRKTRGNKPPFVDWYILEKVEKVKASGKKAPIRIYSRRSTILPQFVGLNFEVHNGKNFLPIFISENMIGYKFGEFIPTRFFKAHGGDKTAAKGKPSGGK
jgi:small subunit ribosomal protein S19